MYIECSWHIYIEHRNPETRKTRNDFLVQVRNFFITFEFKGYDIRKRDAQSFYDDFSICTPLRAYPPQGRWPGFGEQAKVNRLLPSQELNSTNWLFQNHQNIPRALPVHDVIHIHWSTFLSGIFILTSVNDTSSRTRVNTCAQVCT